MRAKRWARTPSAEYGANREAKLLHFTAGIPAWEAYRNTPHAADWHHAHSKVNHAC
jgi:hypothetical protein